MNGKTTGCRIRHYGDDTPFGKWLRDKASTGDLPSNSLDLGVIATDIDMLVKCWKVNAKKKDVQCLFWIELKTRGGKVGFAQESIFASLAPFSSQKVVGNNVIRFYGILRLLMSGTTPRNSDSMILSRFAWKPKGWKSLPTPDDLIETEITEDQLVKLLACKIHPTSLNPWKAFSKTHHGETVTIERIQSPLGLVYDRPIRKAY